MKLAQSITFSPAKMPCAIEGPSLKFQVNSGFRNGFRPTSPRLATRATHIAGRRGDGEEIGRERKSGRDRHSKSFVAANAAKPSLYNTRTGTVKTVLRRADRPPFDAERWNKNGTVAFHSVIARSRRASEGEGDEDLERSSDAEACSQAGRDGRSARPRLDGFRLRHRG
jgi:hypothetical protein